ncbi:transposase [Streptomyces sp. 8N114]|uniref:transposase n=1 Tax=Streptomyces sp. 8N114 TaxID=3457419 RepID=UPI003FD5777A
MPGIGVRTGARILIDVGHGSSPTVAHLATCAGLAPATRSSGSSIRAEQSSRRGNKQLKRAFLLSAFAALADPVSRATTTRRSLEESTAPKRSSASRDDEPTCSSRCLRRHLLRPPIRPTG